jgi:hypothetical protein
LNLAFPINKNAIIEQKGKIKIIKLPENVEILV